MSPVRRIAAGLALATVTTLAIATPASAHDQLMSSTPAADEQLAAAPESITMTFSGELLVLDESLTSPETPTVPGDGRARSDTHPRRTSRHRTCSRTGRYRRANEPERNSWRPMSSSGMRSRRPERSAGPCPASTG